MKLTDCYYEKKDWRACKDEVSLPGLKDGNIMNAVDLIMASLFKLDSGLTFLIDGKVPGVLEGT